MSRTYSWAMGSMATGPSGHGRPALIRFAIAASSGVYRAARGRLGSLCGRAASSTRTRRSHRTSSGERARLRPYRTWGPEQCGHASSAGHRSGPPTELSCTVGAPGRGCSRVAVRASGAS
ncbi:hypothetical protein CW362_27150 [Streptomyces populi]|uniref:Uncharacterized protein n=1 Tax=Streptomyces populi TaxID=2058924 RepID=A0A2I0SJ22_9ACTN|nr:hypothetical protein CW362_27150 [Streptomyces populi]